MSQNKTVIQGLEPADTYTGDASRGTSDFYSRGARPAARGTIVPGMTDGPEPAHRSTPSAGPRNHKPAQPGKPIVGFLYSISRTRSGEYWPLQIGRNTIGTAPSSDVCLPEGTVSEAHAIIVVREIKNTGAIIAAITDTQSTNGTMINGETIGFAAVECHNGDVITIGNNYELVLILIDAAQLHLSVSKDFIPVETENEDEWEDVPHFNGNGNTQPGQFDPYADNNGWPGGGHFNDGTIGLDGSNSNNNHGGTKPM